ncbi:hypothetical protein VTH82DRAFT_4796 [Thermothelomyces myriococcoides]
MNLESTGPKTAAEVSTSKTPGPILTAPTDASSDNTASSQKPGTVACTQSDTPDKAAADTSVEFIKETPPTPSQEATALLVKRASETATTSTSAKMGHKTRKGILYVTCFFVPPLAVYLRCGANKDMGLNVLLTLLGWIAGVLHAMYLVSK